MTTDEADVAGLALQRRCGADQERTFVLGEHQAANVRGVNHRVDDRERGVGVGRGNVFHRVGEEEADADDRIGLLLHQQGEVGLAVFVLDCFELDLLDAELTDGLVETTAGGVVERTVAASTGVEGDPGGDVARRGSNCRGRACVVVDDDLVLEPQAAASRPSAATVASNVNRLLLRISSPPWSLFCRWTEYPIGIVAMGKSPLHTPWSRRIGPGRRCTSPLYNHRANACHNVSTPRAAPLRGSSSSPCCSWSTASSPPCSPAQVHRQRPRRPPRARRWWSAADPLLP